MSELRQIAIGAKDPGRLAEFYRQVVGLSAVTQDDGGLSVSDGVFSIALLPVEGGKKPGLRFVGIHVEDLDETLKRLKANAAKGGEAAHPNRFSDPDGNLVEISDKAFKVAAEKSPYPVRHIALYTPSPKKLADFYCNNFGMKAVADTDRSSIFVSDGYLNLALLYQRTNEPIGLNHFGFHVYNNETVRQLAQKAGVSPGTRRPSRIPYAEFRVHDPEGNGFDLSEKGWEV
jgi:catechol 2,3-dioxygenase-like lactoylglutathione lyase family enzyme